MNYSEVYRRRVRLYQRISMRWREGEVRIVSFDLGARLTVCVTFLIYISWMLWLAWDWLFGDAPWPWLAKILSISFMPILFFGAHYAFPDRQTVREWFAASDVTIFEEDPAKPVTLWGRHDAADPAGS